MTKFSSAIMRTCSCVCSACVNGGCGACSSGAHVASAAESGVVCAGAVNACGVFHRPGGHCSDVTSSVDCELDDEKYFLIKVKCDGSTGRFVRVRAAAYVQSIRRSKPSSFAWTSDCSGWHCRGHCTSRSCMADLHLCELDAWGLSPNF